MASEVVKNRGANVTVAGGCGKSRILVETCAFTHVSSANVDGKAILRQLHAVAKSKCRAFLIDEGSMVSISGFGEHYKLCNLMGPCLLYLAIGMGNSRQYQTAKILAYGRQCLGPILCTSLLMPCLLKLTDTDEVENTIITHLSKAFILPTINKHGVDIQLNREIFAERRFVLQTRVVLTLKIT